MLLPNPFPLFIPAMLWLITGGPYIGWLKRKMFGQVVREDGPQGHQKKTGTPTMGGLLLIGLVLVTFIGFVALKPLLLTPSVAWVLLTLVVFGGLGFCDDWIKVSRKHNKGVSGYTKLGVQVMVGLAVGLWVCVQMPQNASLALGAWALPLGLAYPVFSAIVVTGASNAYNLTDGLDGLAAATGFLTFLGFSVILTSQPAMMLLSMVMAGACLGFLWFNRHPAKVFMGDTGSLALGGAMGTMAVLGHVELLLVLLGGIYVLETLSVMLQVVYFKATKGKRLFKMSPLHHHFELSGWKEPTVVLTFSLVQACFTVLAIFVYYECWNSTPF